MRIYKGKMKIIYGALLVLFVSLLFAVPAKAIKTSAQYLLLREAETGLVLLEKNADELMSPASLSKLMTVLLVFEALEEERITLDDKLFVSDNAWKKGGATSGGSTMFLEARTEVRVEDLLRGVIVQSGNDACIVLAEGLAGSEENFALQMTERARELGLVNSSFANATGLPQADHKSSARDLAVIAEQLIYKHQDFYKLFSEESFTWSGITQPNRNPVLGASLGVDGLKTGFTSESGYGLVASAIQKERRLILVMNGLASRAQRRNEALQLLSWGFRGFSKKILVRKGEKVVLAEIWHGKEKKIALTVPEDFWVTLPMRGEARMMVKASYEKPLQAPLKAGQEVGTLRLELPNFKTQETPLIVVDDVEREGFVGRVLSSIRDILFE